LAVIEFKPRVFDLLGKCFTNELHS
jgi:hypothetical protein